MKQFIYSTRSKNLSNLIILKFNKQFEKNVLQIKIYIEIYYNNIKKLKLHNICMYIYYAMNYILMNNINIP